jgi:hypothetical protein
MSSANCASVMCGEVGKSNVNRILSRGPKTLSCGTPDLIGWEVESILSILTEYVLLERYDCISRKYVLVGEVLF